MLVTIFCDASFCDKHKAVGVAGWIKSDRIEQGVIYSASINWQIQHSTQAEVCSAIFSIGAALNNGIAKPGDSILVQCDCTGIEGYLRGLQRETSTDVDLKLINWIRQIRNEFQLRIIYRHVKGHRPQNKDSRSRLNVLCDRMAYEKMKNLRSKLQKELNNELL